MPTVLYLKGWRFFFYTNLQKWDDTSVNCNPNPARVLQAQKWRSHFVLWYYSDEGNEPIHIHVQKGDSEGKYWLDIDLYEIREAYSYAMSSRDIREVKKIILQNFDEIVDEWQTFRSQQNG